MHCKYVSYVLTYAAYKVVSITYVFKSSSVQLILQIIFLSGGGSSYVG